MVVLSRRPSSPRHLFYCKLDVKNDALINLADNLKTKGLPPLLHPLRAVEPDKNSRREIANQRRGEGCHREAKASAGWWRTDSQGIRRVITLKNYPSSEFHRFTSTRSRFSAELRRYFVLSWFLRHTAIRAGANKAKKWNIERRGNKKLTTAERNGE